MRRRKISDQAPMKNDTLFINTALTKGAIFGSYCTKKLQEIRPKIAFLWHKGKKYGTN
jgi:hypothetical protein